MSRLSATQANPSLIIWARRNSGRTVDDVAKQLGLTADHYGDVEAGKRSLTLAQLRHLAELVKRPLATFYLSAAPPDVKKPHDYRSSSGAVEREGFLSFRKAARVQELSIAPFKRDSALFRIRGHVDLPPDKLAASARDAIDLTHDRQLGFRNSTEFTEWLVGVLESLGVHVLFHAYPVTDSKAYTLPGEPPVIVINRRDWANSQLFSLLHELCHLLLQKPGMCDTIGAGGGSEIETYCNQFAANFILPTPWFKQVLGGYDAESLTDDETLDSLAKTFATSRDVVLLKLIYLDVVDQSAYAAYRSRWDADAAFRRGKGGRTSIKANALRDNGKLFISEVAAAYVSNRIGVVDAAELLGVNPSYVEDVVGVPGGAG